MKKITCIVITLVILFSSITFAISTTKSIVVSPNTATVFVNGSTVLSDNFNYNGTLYIPLRAISENMGANVGWDQSTKTASIVTSTLSPADNSYNYAYSVSMTSDYYSLQSGFDLIMGISDLSRNIYLVSSLQTQYNKSALSQSYQKAKAKMDEYISSIQNTSNADIIRLIKQLEDNYSASYLAWSTYLSTGNSSAAFDKELVTKNLMFKGHQDSADMIFYILDDARNY